MLYILTLDIENPTEKMARAIRLQHHPVLRRSEPADTGGSLSTRIFLSQSCVQVGRTVQGRQRSLSILVIMMISRSLL